MPAARTTYHLAETPELNCEVEFGILECNGSPSNLN